MKICRLKLKNLNSFRQEVDLDFESSPLGDASLVAITGPTGAGKTTLLDAICVALYDKTPRLSGTGSQNPNHLISHGEKEGFTEVHFIANNTRYIATWSAKQGGPRQGQLRYADDGKLISDKLSNRGKSLGASQNMVSEEVAAILGLDFNAFRRSVMLAQGEFAAFLKAKQENRRQILEATAGIGIYEILKETLNQKVSEVEAANTAVVEALNKIPEASREQLSEAEAELDRLKNAADVLETRSQEIQQEKDRETKRTEDYEKLQSSEERQTELAAQQTEIDNLEEERERAQRANSLRPEKQTFDTATSDLETAENTLRVATTEKTEAEKQVETDQADFEKKEIAYQTASTERDRKAAVYTDAKIDIERAEERFAEASKRNPNLVDLENQVDLLEDELADKQTEHTQLQKRIAEARTFLDENPLPADRQHRLNRVTELLSDLGSEEKQLETTSTSKAQHKKKVSSLKRDIEKLSKAREKGLAEKIEADATLKEASTELRALLATGDREEWNTRKQQAAEAQPIAQKYETTQDDLTDAENRLNALNETASALAAELEQIETDLANQTEVCQEATEAVQRCEAEKESAKWADPINQLRQHLHDGEPCLVCGAIEHPFADVVEPEGEELIQAAESALKNAETEAQAAQAQLQALQTKQVQTEQNRRNTAKQIEDCDAEIETLRNERGQFFEEWQEIYTVADVSFGWTAEQIKAADTAIADLAEAEQGHIKASHAHETTSQHLENCENDVKREKEALRETEQQLQDVSENVAALKVAVADIETRLWDLLPKAFHGDTPKAAKNLFESKMKAVETREDELHRVGTQLQVLKTNIAADQGNLENLKDRHGALQTEIDGYQREGKAFLDAVRDKTGGLETVDAINAAMDTLDTELKAKANDHNETQQQLQKSRDVLTQKQTAYEINETRFKTSAEKVETARDAYFGKLENAGFDSPETHDNAFRDEAQIQDLTDQIDDHEDEKQHLALEITELQTRFEETPFDPEALGQIEAQAEEIGAQLQAKQQEIGAQQQRIDNLKDALEKREALGEEVAAAEAELMRWQRLQDTIPRNDLRDFALEIMFKQMGSLANEQLKYLTSERYQLKVESIGDLTVIDRWNANEERPVETLSGGESFLTSLALALALADLSRGRAQLNSLFLDEGFGTLDAETLDIAIAALEGLRTQGRSIFLISHIQELTRRLPVKINVRKRGDGSSYIGN